MLLLYLHFCAVSPSVDAIITHDGTVFKSSSTALVRVRYRKNSLTCIGLGWPPPIVEWIKNRKHSLGHSTNMTKENSSLVSVLLRFPHRFTEADAGVYTCHVRDVDAGLSRSKSILLEPTTSATPQVLPTACFVHSNTPSFTVRILNTWCSRWGEEVKENIEKDFLGVIRGVIISHCEACNVNFDSVVVTESECSRSVGRAAEIGGYVASGNVSVTGPMFCALRKWLLTGPSIILDGSIYFVDSRKEI